MEAREPDPTVFQQVLDLIDRLVNGLFPIQGAKAVHLPVVGPMGTHGDTQEIFENFTAKVIIY